MIFQTKIFAQNMRFVNRVLTKYFSSQMSRIDYVIEHAQSIQEKTCMELIQLNANTHFGKEHDFQSIRNIESFQNKVPIRGYEDLYPYIERNLKGEQGVLYYDKIKYFSKSSGTTNDRSKYIPISRDSLEKCHYQGAKISLVSTHT